MVIGEIRGNAGNTTHIEVTAYQKMVTCSQGLYRISIIILSLNDCLIVGRKKEKMVIELVQARDLNGR